MKTAGLKGILYEHDEEKLAANLEKAFKDLGVKIAVENWMSTSEKIIFTTKLKKATRLKQVSACLPDVRIRLKLPNLSFELIDNVPCLIIAHQRITYPPLLQILSTPKWKAQLKKMALPYPVGYDSLGKLHMLDLAGLPHLLLGGATNSGKSVSLQILVASIALCKSSPNVNFILIDTGATSLMPFEGLPHLSCPVVKDHATACQVLVYVVKEMEHRIDLSASAPKLFRRLPRLVLVIDEFPALITGNGDKRLARQLTTMISSLLQRGRHAKIHLVLAAQNPTLQTMKVDLGNITTRIAFRCAKRNNSETILGVSGAERLQGQGDLYLSSPHQDELLRLQGVYISPCDLQNTVWVLRENQKVLALSKRKFIISPAPTWPQMENSFKKALKNQLESKMSTDEQLLAQIIAWTIGEDTISCNTICDRFHIGWKRANGFLTQMEEMGIIGDVYAKLPRKVLLHSVEELPPEVAKLLQRNGA